MFRRNRPAPPPGEESYPRRGRHSRPRRSFWLYFFAFLGFAAAIFLIIRYLIIPLLVTLG